MTECLADVKAAATVGPDIVLASLIDRALYLDALSAVLIAPPVAATKSAPPPNPDETAIESKNDVPVYVIGSLFLTDTYDYLMQSSRPDSREGDEVESVALVTGAKFGNTRYWDYLIKSPVSQRSRVNATIGGPDLRAALARLDAAGHALFGAVHLHLHDGPPGPSPTDKELSRKMEDGGYPFIQAVFSKSGHVRFFSDQRKFEVEIYGKGVQKLDHKLYHLAAIPSPPH